MARRTVDVGALARRLRERGVRYALAEGFRWTVRRLRSFYAAAGVFLSVGLALALLALLGFAEVAESVNEGETRRFDEGVLRWMHARGAPWLDTAAVEVTALGDGTVVITLVLIVSVILALVGRRHLAVTLCVATLGGILVNTALKLLFDRPRPQLFEWKTPHAGLSSFPSGHATTAMVVYVALAYVITRLEPTARLRRITFAACALLVLLIGLSRLYLGVHYPSDVIAGYAVGFAWAVFSVLAVEAIRRSRGSASVDAAGGPAELEDSSGSVGSETARRVADGERTHASRGAPHVESPGET